VTSLAISYASKMSNANAFQLRERRVDNVERHYETKRGYGCQDGHGVLFRLIIPSCSEILVQNIGVYSLRDLFKCRHI